MHFNSELNALLPAARGWCDAACCIYMIRRYDVRRSCYRRGDFAAPSADVDGAYTPPS
jgi:hypothetical protein